MAVRDLENFKLSIRGQFRGGQKVARTAGYIAPKCIERYVFYYNLQKQMMKDFMIKGEILIYRPVGKQAKLFDSWNGFKVEEHHI